MDELALKNHKPLREIAGAFCFCLKPGKQLTGTVHRLGTTRKAKPATSQAMRQHLHSGQQAAQMAHLDHVLACRHGQSNGGSKRRRTARTYLLGTRAGACDY